MLLYTPPQKKRPCDAAVGLGRLQRLGGRPNDQRSEEELERFLLLFQKMFPIEMDFCLCHGAAAPYYPLSYAFGPFGTVLFGSNVNEQNQMEPSQNRLDMEKRVDPFACFITFFFIRTSKVKVQAGCSKFPPNFEAKSFLICSYSTFKNMRLGHLEIHRKTIYKRALDVLID